MGNWKMNGSLEMATEYMPSLLDGLLDLHGWEQNARIGICPPFPYLPIIATNCEGYPLHTGAQDVHHKENGAYTGEVSAAMLDDMGIRFCIVGHSERRNYNNETDSLINSKLQALLNTKVQPVLCVGESKSDREMGNQFNVVEVQINNALKGLSSEKIARIVIAYEPVWAIGTGLNATPDQVNEMHNFIRKELGGQVSMGKAQDIPIIYGGSVTPENAGEIMAQPQVNGALVGGASLNPQSFSKIIQQAIG